MTEIFSVLLGKKKQKTPPETPNSEHTFVSYVDKELSDDLKDFVVISPEETGQSIFARSQPSDKTRVNKQSWNSDSSMKMGTTSSTYGNGTFAEIPNNLPPAHAFPPYPPINTVPIVKQTSDEMFGISSFLTGVPFQLSSKLLALQSFKRVQNEGYYYLNSKAQMLENLSYDFQTERQVLEESETAFALGES